MCEDAATLSRVATHLSDVQFASPSADEELHWLALILVPGLGARKSKQLIEKFRTPESVFRASRDQLQDCGIAQATAQTIASGCTFEEAAEQQELLQSLR